MRKIKYICNAKRWFDRVNGNTYHSVKVTRVRDNKVIVGSFQYGYEDHYRQTALEEMLKAGWLRNTKRKGSNFTPGKVNYDKNSLYMYERENNYPIHWDVSDGLKRDCVNNGII